MRQARPIFNGQVNDTVKYGLLLVLSAAALAVLALVVYNFVANDWRLESNPFDLTRLFGDDEEQPQLPSALEERSRSMVAQYPPDSGGAIRIDASNIDVRVSNTDLPRILVQFILNGDAVDTLLFTARTWRDANGTIRVEARPTGAPGNYSGQIQVSVPTSVRLDIRAAVGRVVVQGILGNVEVETRLGDIEGIGIGGHVRMNAASGNISLSASVAGAELTADSGAVSTSLIKGPLVIRAGRGVLSSEHFGSIDATARGQVAVELSDPNAGVTLRSRRGDIILRVPESGQFTFSLDAPLGAVTANVPIDSMLTLPGRTTRLRGTMNGGGRSVVARADSGSVDVSVQMRREE